MSRAATSALPHLALLPAGRCRTNPRRTEAA